MGGEVQYENVKKFIFIKVQFVFESSILAWQSSESINRERIDARVGCKESSCL